MAELGNLFVNIGSKFDPEGFNKARDNLNKVALAAVAAGAALVAVALKAAQAAGVQEQAEFKLAVALGNAVNKTNVSIDSLVEYAGELQKVTTFGDETTMKVMQMGLSMGITADKIMDATTSAVGLSKSLNMDLNAAMKMTALAIEGDYNMLTRYLPALKTAKTEAEKTAIVNKAMADGFKLAKAETETYLGKVEQLKNRLGDLFEVLGKMIIPVLMELINLINQNILPAFENWGNDIEKSGKATDIFKNILRATISVVMGAVDAFNIAGQAVALFFLAINGQWRAAKIGLDELENKVIEMGNKFKRVWNKEASDFDKKEKDKVASQVEANNMLIGAEIVKNEALTEIAIIKQEEEIARGEELEAAKESWANRYASVMADSLSMILTAETTTWASIAVAYGQAVKRMIGYVIQQLAAEKIKAVAIAVMNSTITWGAAAYQIGAVIATSTAAMVGLKQLMNFDKGGIIPGVRGTPQLVMAHAGETILPTHKSGGEWGNIIVNVPPITTRQEARRMGEIVGNEIYRKFKAGRKV